MRIMATFKVLLLMVVVAAFALNSPEVMGLAIVGSDDCAVVNSIPGEECESLVSLYNSTDGSNWANQTDWLATTTPCSWFGITCSDGRVSIISLTNNQLTGAIPPELSNLASQGNKGVECFGSSSNTISLGFNLLDSEVDPEIGSCPTIETDLALGGKPIQDVLEASLGSNPGLTQTHVLVEGSMAIDAIPIADCSDADGNPVTADQRGVVRPQGAACDIGAFEFDQPLAAEAIGSFDLHQDILDGATGLKVAITQATRPVTGSSVAAPLEGFQVQLTYDGNCLNILALRELDFQITAETIHDPGGSAAFDGADLEGQFAPVDLGLALTRLAGSNQVPCDVDLKITALTENGGKPISVVSTGLNRRLLRGDLRADGVINIADAEFIAQYLLGSRGACTTVATTSCLHSVNAASVLQDGAFDKKTIADALFLAQYSMVQRDEFYNLVP